MKPASCSKNEFDDLTTFIRRSVFNIAQFFSNSRFVLHGSGKLRRFLQVHFRKTYIQRQLSVRQGVCKQCGSCCDLLFTCPMLMKRGRCLAYGACRPQACKVFPVDQRDINEVKLCGARCGYRFEQPESQAMGSSSLLCHH